MLLNKINSPRALKKLSPQQLEQLTRELRHFILTHVARTGGHLASSLGAVEITIALHRFLNAPFDQIVWDVGHQSYTHKILTGRRTKFKKLRQLGGISGFPNREESPYDSFGAGHASTSLSAAMGLAEAFKKQYTQNKRPRVAAVIGDGSLTGGLALEAINQIGYLRTPVIIILNDNRMSISENVGSLSRYTKRIEETEIYQNVKQKLERLKKDWPKFRRLSASARNLQDFRDLKKAFKQVGTPGLVFEKLGLNYVGPVDGHSIPELIKALKKAEQLMKKHSGPVLIHARTKKGMGYKLAEKSAEKFHGISPFSLKNGETFEKSQGPSFSTVFGQKLLKLGKKDPRIIAITAAMPAGTGLNYFANELPEQFYDVGICEQHAVTFAAGLAAAGQRPVVAIYSSFLQRSFDQIIHDVCLQKLPVIFALDRAGLVGEDGPTHHGVFDLSYLRSIPNLTIMAPKDGRELTAMLELALKINGPVALRYPRGSSENIPLPNWCRSKDGLCASSRQPFRSVNYQSAPVKKNKAEIIFPGSGQVIIAVGPQLAKAFQLARLQQPRPTIINARFIKPIDEQIFQEIARTPKATIIEENVKAGGFGSAVLEGLAKRKIQAAVKLIGIDDRFIEHGKTDELRRKWLK